jgi:hypothetical protein
MNIRFTNALLLALLIILGLSGVVMLYGAWQPWVFDLHRMTGFALIALLPWKGVIVYRSLQRGVGDTLDRSVVLFLSLFLAFMLLFVLAMALMWTFRLGPYRFLIYQLIAWHWLVGLILGPALAIHVWRRWPRPRLADFTTRRNLLKLLGIGGVGVVAGSLTTRLAQRLATAERPRRFTGSRGFGLFAGNDFPVTGETPLQIEAEEWRLHLDGAVATPLSFSYEEILQRAMQRKTAVIDCTNGWYSIQDWGGVPLVALLEEAGMPPNATGVRLISASGYNHAYPLGEARQILLATHVGDETLSPQHGFPLRAVVPGRRGWFWVKWLSRVDVLDSYRALIGGILWSPRQVLRQF